MAGGPVVVLTEPKLRLDSEPTLRDISEALITVYGTDFGIHTPRWISRFTDMTRQAAAYRDKRSCSPATPRTYIPRWVAGLNIGVQDAVNLGWKLAQVIKRTSPDSLLDTYHTERPRGRCPRTAQHDGADRASSYGRPHKPWATPFPSSLGWTSLADESPRRCPVWAFITTSATATRCSGAAMPDLDLVTANGPLRVFTLLHDARPVAAQNSMSAAAST